MIQLSKKYPYCGLNVSCLSVIRMFDLYSYMILYGACTCVLMFCFVTSIIWHFLCSYPVYGIIQLWVHATTHFILTRCRTVIMVQDAYRDIPQQQRTCTDKKRNSKLALKLRGWSPKVVMSYHSHISVFWSALTYPFMNMKWFAWFRLAPPLMYGEINAFLHSSNPLLPHVSQCMQIDITSCLAGTWYALKSCPNKVWCNNIPI